MGKHAGLSKGAWDGRFWADLGERTGATAVYGVITLLTLDQTVLPHFTIEQAWVVVGLPTALAALKGLALNFKNPESGASALPAPPGPRL